MHQFAKTLRHWGRERPIGEIHRQYCATRNDTHLEPVLLIVRVPRADPRKLVVQRIDIPDVPERLIARLACKHLKNRLDHTLTPISFIFRRPSGVMRSLFQGGFQTSLISTDSTEGI